MSTALEFLGISPGGLNGIPATDPAKLDAAEAAGRLVMELVNAGTRPSQIMTRAAIDNAIASVAATGGSTNGVLHLLAIAHELGIPLELEDFDRIAERTPIVASLMPGGRFTALDIHEAGGIGLVARELLKQDLVDGSTRNVDGRTLAEVADAAVETTGQEVVVSIDHPIKATGGLAILRGSLAPDGCVIKLAGHERRHFRGPARVFESEAACYDAVRAQRIGAGDVVVIRYEGPVGGPGHAGDALGHCRPGGRRPGWRRGAHHRRPIQRRHPRPDDRARGTRGGPWRTDRARSQRATRSSSTSTRVAWTSSSMTASWRAGARTGSDRRPGTPEASWPSTPRSSPRHRRARSRRAAGWHGRSRSSDPLGRKGQRRWLTSLLAFRACPRSAARAPHDRALQPASAGAIGLLLVIAILRLVILLGWRDGGRATD